MVKILKAPVVEIFQSVQGEGETLGVPSVFVRFYGCNLRCSYCDTPYAVDKEKNKAKEMTPDEVIDEIFKYDLTNIVFTGGEPMLYKRFINNTIKKLPVIYTVEIETNGTISPFPLNFLRDIKFNVSPKLSNSGVKRSQRIKHLSLSTFPYNKTVFKFVVSTIEDVNEVLKLKNKHNFKIYLMPEGIDRKTIIKNSKFVIEQCLKHNLNYSPREHIMIWNKKRGI